MSDEIVAIPIPSNLGSIGSVPQGTSPQAKADILGQIKPELMVEVVRHKLLGEEWKNNEWISVPALKNRKLTEIGAWELSNLMLGVGSINISISKFSDREIKERLFRIAKSAQVLALENWRIYGIHSVSQFYYIHEIVFSNTMGVLKQADGGSIQELLKVVVNENRNVVTQPKEPRGTKIRRMLGLAD